jgi:enoyl-CoA hydratase
MTHELIFVEARDRVGVVTLNRPEARNALNNQMVHDLLNALEGLDRDPAVGAMVLWGNDRAFAAGADIKEMAEKDAGEMMASDFIQAFGRITSIAKPLIAAVSGWALGGGCELALACDLIVASETARFGQPEITIGAIPGAGGTQRLPRVVGKYVAMEMILNNRILSAQEAQQLGMVNLVVPVERCLEESINLAREIAARAPLAARAATRMIDQAVDRALEGGLEQERQAFFEVFASRDRSEGMNAFVERREPQWTGQ